MTRTVSTIEETASLVGIGRTTLESLVFTNGATKWHQGNASVAKRRYKTAANSVKSCNPGVANTMSAKEYWYVYLLRCADQTLYTGIARDVKKRIAVHESGKGARYTRGRGPFVLLATRRCLGHGEALRLEYAIKQLPRADKESLTVGRRLASFAREFKDTSLV